MKGLDTPILLAILHDTPVGRLVLKEVRGHEVGTTELNMLELRFIALTGREANRGIRADALARMRRRLTVVPFASPSLDIGADILLRSGVSLPYAMAWGPLCAAGCTEWITTRDFAPRARRPPFKLRIVEENETKIMKTR